MVSVPHWSASLLMVACASAANLLLARRWSPLREIAVRLAISALDARRPARETQTEALVWTPAGIPGGGLLIASWGANALVALMTTREQHRLTSTRASISGSCCSALARCRGDLRTSARCCRRSGATRIHPAAGLRAAPDSSRAIPSRWASGRWIVAAQVALSVLLLGSAALFGRSLPSAAHKSAGVDRQNVLVLATDVDAD